MTSTVIAQSLRPFLFIPSLVSNFPADTALTAPVWFDAGIFDRERMPSDAVRFLRIYPSRTNATKHIFPLRHRLHVLGVHTQRVSAKVIELKPIRDRTNALLVHPAVRRNKNTVEPIPTIPAAVFPKLPDPARRRVAAILLKKQIGIRRSSASPMMTMQKPERLTLDLSVSSICLFGKIRLATAAALAETIGDIWGRIFSHRSYSFGVVAGSVDALPGRFVPQLYATRGVN